MRPLGPFARGPALRQVQRQTQTLAMTPQLRQAIQLLQLSNLELNTWLEEALETNPLLARDDGVSENGAGDNGAAREEPHRADAADPAPLDFVGESGFAAPDGFGETAAANLWDGDGDPGSFGGDWSGRGGGAGAGDGEDLPDYRQTLADKPPLREHLLQQIRLALVDPVERMIAAQLVDQLDEAGYLSGDLDALASTLGVSRRALDAVVAKLHGLEPVGVFARTLAECLAIQLRDRNRFDPAMQALLANLELLARGDKARLMRVCGVDAEDLDDMIAEIRTLDPRPAAGFDAPPASPLIPDVLMRVAPGGKGWIVELNSDTLPRLIVDRRYYDTVARTGNGKARDARRFLAARLQEANWLVRALDQRARTILRVATAIVERQRAFFEHGIAQLRPLVLRDIAEAIEVHESTVSRATSNKYIATPRGTYELKFFFSTAVGAAANGEAHSAESIRHRIKSLIAGESDILSDDAIVAALRREGYELARRTVAKYREAMRIPSSVERRRMKALTHR
jgi:RNA polymerase sigma-54 factor